MSRRYCHCSDTNRSKPAPLSQYILCAFAPLPPKAPGFLPGAPASGSPADEHQPPQIRSTLWYNAKQAGGVSMPRAHSTQQVRRPLLWHRLLVGESGQLRPNRRADRSGTLIAALALSTVFFATRASADPPFFMGLGRLPADSRSSAAGVSADGTVVVGTSIGVINQAFRWTRTGGMVALGSLLPGADSQAFGVSADGSVVVGQAATSRGTRRFAGRTMAAWPAWGFCWTITQAVPPVFQPMAQWSWETPTH